MLNTLVSRFRLLQDWKVKEGKCHNYRAQVIINPRQKTAIICPWWDGEEPPADYLMHEVLHVVLRAYAFSKDHEAEETTVQDLCTLLKQ